MKYIKPSTEEVKNKLTPTQYHVTQEAGTEMPYKNEYWDNKTEGIYVDIVSGEPLFSSADKFDSGCGWPGFTKTIAGRKLTEKEDLELPYEKRVELRSSIADSHLGHKFDNWPLKQSSGKVHYVTNYCINSAALEFIPKDQLAARGYGEYLNLFADS